MLGMAQKSRIPNTKQSRGAVNVNVWLSPPIGEAFRKYLETTRPTPTNTAAIELAVEMLVKSVGIEIERGK